MHTLDLLKHLIKAGCIVVGPETRLKDGSLSPIYIDLRAKLWEYPALLWEMGVMFYQYISELADEEAGHTGRILVCGIPEAANPLATATVLLADQYSDEHFALIALRHAPKAYGSGNQKSFVIGEYRSGDHVYLLDDVITTSTSKREAINRLILSGFPRDAITVVVGFDRQQGGLESMERDGIRCASVFRILEVAELLHKHEEITDNQLVKVQTFIAENQHTT